MTGQSVVIERAITENGEIQLQKRGSDYEIIFNGTFLMATHNGESEKLLVKWAVEAANMPKTILIAGLGVGYSLVQALKHKTVEKITVVEIEKKIIEWNRTYLSKFSGNVLANKKVDVVNADFIQWIHDSRQKYDVVCVDIDNGPEWVVIDKNNKLYSEPGVVSVSKIVNESGSVSFWSASKSRVFETRLKRHFKKVHVKDVNKRKGEPDYIYVGSK